MVPVVGDYRDRLSVVARQHAFHGATAVRLEGHPVTNPELQHLLVRPHLLQKAEPLDNPVVEINQLRLGQPVDVDCHPSLPLASACQLMKSCAPKPVCREDRLWKPRHACATCHSGSAATAG